MENGSRANESLKDAPTVMADGTSVATLPDGVMFRDAVTHVDDRGSVCEMFDERWDWHPEPLVFSYFFTLEPGHVKGWGMHLLHEDRYFLIKGRVEIVMYDERDDSPTNGLVSSVVLSEYHRRLMSIPTGVWHANRNIGSTEALVVNFPTQPYDHANPDKYRLPLDTDRIPYEWPDPRGW